MLSLIFFSAVAFAGSAPIVPSPSIQIDQAASLLVPVRTFPIQVSIDPRFDGRYRTAIINGLMQWNAIAKKELSFEFFKLESNPGSQGIQFNKLALGSRYCSLPIHRPHGLAIVADESADNWKDSALADSVYGYVQRCRVDLLSTEMLMVLPTFSSSHRDRAERELTLKNVILHELGHVLGLNHSCVVQNARATYRSCSGLEYDHAYRQAVMYPRTNAREAREVIGKNDIDRIRWLYQYLKKL